MLRVFGNTKYNNMCAYDMLGRGSTEKGRNVWSHEVNTQRFLKSKSGKKQGRVEGNDGETGRHLAKSQP